MTFVRTLVSIVVLSSTALAASSWAAADDQHDSHHPAPATATQIAQAQQGMGIGMGMHAGVPVSGYADQMKAMQQIHDQMVTSRTPEERNALMSAQMALMQNGMSMMGGMGGMGGNMGAGAATDNRADMAARQDMLEQRMNLMQSMMQMMMDRVLPVPATK